MIGWRASEPAKDKYQELKTTGRTKEQLKKNNEESFRKGVNIK